MSEFDIQKSFCDVDLETDDIVMIHGDAGVAAQYMDLTSERRLDYLIDQMKEYFSPAGTILIPAFSYSSTKNEVYDVNETSSAVGLFSERFRHGPDVERTRHPIFSVSTWGRFGCDFLEGSNYDCFGPGTFFDMILKRNVKLVALGCDLNNLTFVHYVEQQKDVNYRSFKTFNGNIIDGKCRIRVDTKYYVRDMALKTGCNLKLFGEVAERKELLRIGSAGRFPLKVIGSADFYKVAMDLLVKDEYSLIDEGVIGSDI